MSIQMPPPEPTPVLATIERILGFLPAFALILFLPVGPMPSIVLYCSNI